MPAGDRRGQIKCFIAGTQVRRRANTRTRLLPRSIVPSASVSSSGELGSWGFLIGQADPADTRSLPLQWSTGTYHCLGVGDVPGKLGLSSTKDWEPASYTGGPWGPPISHTGGLLYPPTSAASLMGGQSWGSRELTTSPSRGLLHGHLVSRFKRAKPLPFTYPSTDHGSAVDPNTTAILQTGCLREQRAQSALCPPQPVLFSSKLHGL